MKGILMQNISYLLDSIKLPKHTTKKFSSKEKILNSIVCLSFLGIKNYRLNSKSENHLLSLSSIYRYFALYPELKGLFFKPSSLQPSE